MSFFSFLCSSSSAGDRPKRQRRRTKHSLDSDLDSIISPIISPITVPLISAPIPYKYRAGEPAANSIRQLDPHMDVRCKSWSWQEQQRLKDRAGPGDRGLSKSLHAQRNTELSESFQEAKKALLSSTPENPANLRMTVVRDSQSVGQNYLSVRRGQRVRVLYKLGDWLWAELKSGEGGYVPYSHCRLSKKHYCTPIHALDKRETKFQSKVSFTQSLNEEKRSQVGQLFAETTSPKRSFNQSISPPRNGSIPQELEQIIEHKCLLGAKLREYTVTSPGVSFREGGPLLPLIGRTREPRPNEKRRPSLFAGYKHTYTASGNHKGDWNVIDWATREEVDLMSE